MNKSKIISAIITVANVVLSYLFLKLIFVFFVSGFSFFHASKFWFGYFEIGQYRIMSGVNFDSDSRGLIWSWFVLILILLILLFIATISIVTGYNFKNL